MIWLHDRTQYADAGVGVGEAAQRCVVGTEGVQRLMTSEKGSG